MGTLVDGSTNWEGTIAVSKQSGTKVTLDTDKKYIAKDIELTIKVAGGSASTPSTSITTNPTITMSDTGLITASYSGSKSITPTVSSGWISSGTSGTVSTSGSSTYQIPVATIAETKAYLGIV